MEAVKIEFDKMYNGSFHDEHHFPDSVMATRHHLPWNKTMWFGKTDYIDVPCSVIDPKDNKLVYTFDSKFDLLNHTKLDVVLPEIKTKSDSIRAAWPKDIFIHLIKSSTFNQDDEIKSTLTGGSIDINHNFFETNHVREMEKQARGNVPELTEFSTFLPEYHLDFVQPWFYNIHTSNAFPLIFNEKKEGRTKHVYDFRRKLSELLRIQVFNDVTQEWVDVKFDQSYITDEKLLEINKPQLSAIYSILTEKEKEAYLSDCDKFKEHKIYRWTEYVYLNKDVFKTIGDTYELNIKTSTPCFALFWFPDNRRCTHLNNFGNYTTDMKDSENGQNPIVKYILKYNNQITKSEGNCQHRCISQVRNHFPNKPTKNGFGVISNAWYMATEAQSDIALDYSKVDVTLFLHLNDSSIEDEYQKELNAVRKSMTTEVYQINVIAAISRKMEIVKVDGVRVFNIDKYAIETK